MKIFVSYSRRDASGTAKEIHDYLTEIGHHEVFIDTSDIPGGDEWWRIIKDNISDCNIFLIIVTRAALQRPYVKEEVEFAKSLKKKIIPCIPKKYIRYEDLPWDLNKYQGIMFERLDDLIQELDYIIELEKAQGKTEKKPVDTSSKTKDDLKSKEISSSYYKYSPNYKEHSLASESKKAKSINLKILIPIMVIGTIVSIFFIFIIQSSYYKDSKTIQPETPQLPSKTIQSPLTFSSGFERQEITDGDNDWILWHSDLQESIINLQDNTLQNIPVTNNETDCKSDIKISPQIKSISYMGNDERLNTTMWLSADLLESILQKNRLNKENFGEQTLLPLWKKMKFTVVIDILSTFNQGIDYSIELVNQRINSTTEKWSEIIYEISANGEKKEISKKLFDEFPYAHKNFIDFSIDLNKISNPKDYKILFYITDLFIKNGKLCRMVDSTNWIYSNPPNFNILLSENPVNMKPGEEKDILINIEGDNKFPVEATLYVIKTNPFVSLSFPISNKTIISSQTSENSLLHLNVSDSVFETSKRLIIPIMANISFAPTISIQRGDTFQNNQSTLLLETINLTVNIERSYSPLEQIEEYISFLKPIEGVWSTLTIIIIISLLIYFIKKRKKGNDKTLK